MSVPSSTSRISIIDRLTRADRLDLVAAIEAGKVSAFAVACAMGWKKRPPILGTGPRNRAKRRDAVIEQLLLGNGRALPAPETDSNGGELSLRDSVELCELCYGEDQSGSCFANREELRAAWEKHRAAAFEVMKGSGHKPAAWHEFEGARKKERPPRRQGVKRAEARKELHS
jgi:hypothetical protein